MCVCLEELIKPAVRLVGHLMVVRTHRLDACCAINVYDSRECSSRPVIEPVYSYVSGQALGMSHVHLESL